METFWPFVKNVSAGYSKRQSTCPEEKFEVTFSNGKHLYFYIMFTLNKKTAMFSENIYVGLSELHSTCLEKHFEEH